VLVAVRQSQRRDAVATVEEQLGRFAARKSEYISRGDVPLTSFFRWPKLCGGRSSTNACLYRWRLRHITRRGPPAALPGKGVWRDAWGDGAHCPYAAQRVHGAHCPPLFLVPLRSSAANKKVLLVPSYVVRVDSFGVGSIKIRNAPLVVSF
jgi:hypothetical protein